MCILFHIKGANHFNNGTLTKGNPSQESGIMGMLGESGREE